MNIDQIVKELSDEKSNRVSHRFPCRAIMVPSIEEYNYLFERLSGICDVIITGDELCSNDDTLPEYNLLSTKLRTEYADKWILLPGVSEYLRLFSHYEEKEGSQGAFYLLWHTMLDSMSLTRVIIPMIDCSSAWERLHLSDDLRMSDFVIKPDEVPDEMPRIQVRVFANTLLDTVLSLNNSTSAVLLNIREWLNVWSDVSNPVDPQLTDFILVTGLYRLIEKYNGTFSVKIIDSAFSFIKDAAIDGDKLKSTWALEDTMRLLMPDIADGKSVAEAILHSLNMHSFDGCIFMDKWENLNRAEKQLALMWANMTDERTYFQHCATKVDSIDNLPREIQMEIFNVKQGHPQWLQEYFDLNKKISLGKDSAWFSSIDAIPSWEEKLQFLSDKTLAEQKYIIRLAGKVIKQYGVSPKTIGERIKTLFPLFSEYLCSCDIIGDESLTLYFETYKKNKITNVYPADAMDMLSHIHVDSYPYRYQILSQFSNEQAFVLWVDALGAEWLPCLYHTIERTISNASFAHVGVVQATLPSETVFNNQWEEMTVNHDKMNGLDQLAHHGQIDDNSYEACIAGQLAFMQKIADKVNSLLQYNQTVIITGDHGTSRPAALAFHMNELAMNAPKNAKVMCHGRFCELEGDSAIHSEYERQSKLGDTSYLVFKTYHHYAVGGNAAGYNDEETMTYGELHGGATPEEMLVPVIVVKNNQDVLPLEVKIVETQVKRKNNNAEIQAVANRPIGEMKAKLGNVTATCIKGIDAMHWTIKWTNAQIGTYDLSITADNCQMKNLPKVQIIKNGLEEDDLFGDDEL